MKCDLANENSYLALPRGNIGIGKSDQGNSRSNPAKEKSNPGIARSDQRNRKSDLGISQSKVETANSNLEVRKSNLEIANCDVAFAKGDLGIPECNRTIGESNLAAHFRQQGITTARKSARERAASDGRQPALRTQPIHRVTRLAAIGLASFAD